MTTHVRKTIRAAAVTALGTLSTVAAANVFDSRVYPLQDSDLPALRVDTLDESIDFGGMGGSGRAIERKLQLVVQACVKQNTTYNDTLDDIAKEVEIAFGANQGIGGAKYVQLKSYTVGLSDEAEKPIAVATMIFEVLYYTALSTPFTAL